MIQKRHGFEVRESGMKIGNINEVYMTDIKIRMNGKEVKIKRGTRVSEVLSKCSHKGEYQPLGAIIDRRLDGLYYKLGSNAEVTTVDLSAREGMDIYRRTACLLLYAALGDIAPGTRITVGQSISDGYFFEMHGHVVNNKLLKDIEKKMNELVEANVEIIPKWATIEEAINILESAGQHDKANLLEQSRRTDISMINLESYHGCVYGPLANRTGLIDKFAIYPYEHGFILGFPDSKGYIPKSIPDQPKLFATYLETKKWDTLMNVENVAQFNEKCISGEISDLVKVAEALHERRVGEIADSILKQKDSRLVLIAGPSGSGKTTFMKRLAIQLKLHGYYPRTISLDNYYVDRKKTPKHPDGSYNYECLEALDVDLLNTQLKDLMHGKEVTIPSYSFLHGKRDLARGKQMFLDKNEILMVEGIHGLNDALTPSIPREHKFKVYLSALTQLCLDDHNRIFSTDTRLIRRIVRDRLFRGTSAAETIQGWPSVRDGEGINIFPYQESADAIFNSALLYEHALLKTYAERALMEVPREHPSFIESTRLTRFFSFFIPIFSREVPHTSIMREFIGGSSFNY